ncbi:class III lanthionine synthetase LanKC [Enterococcus casseliflavus]|uniref:class III lanthionine synthetase LanKC n=1 Tax=Enterococcus casseliflavus TaxID=37734 RepID=UPI0018835118|nr:class III lanthionine synthetase LanKC [Enterococcus casseliflavus]MBE9908972.1 protein kinase/lanthionine synthetase C family protein [Enterococcus casseliflavus]
MNGNMLYNSYLKPNSDYYEKSTDQELGDLYQIKMVPKVYEVSEKQNSVWKYYHFKKKKLPKQGWKIHVTSSYQDSENLLECVAKTCFEKCIDFKHLKDKPSYLTMNSKNADRASSGKFITIYPLNEDIFLDMLEILAFKTQNFKQGPYILSDKRWKNTNVFYRYGAFKNMINEKGEYCIEDPDGQLILDERAPFYQCPTFAKDFDEFLNSLNIVKENQSYSHLEEYDIEGSITSSNSGGVYVATKKDSNKKVIIKEARPHSGLDGMNKDALYRQKNEYKALKALNNVDSVVSIIDYFQEWEHYFLVEEFIEGQDLKKWISQYFPFYADKEAIRLYCDKAKKIIANVINAVEKIHDCGIAMGDIQPANILISEDLSIKLIDFETATCINGNDKPSLMTIGFASKKIINNASRDWFGVKKIAKYMALPVLTSEDLDPYLDANHFNWIRENYTAGFFRFIMNIQKICDERIGPNQSNNDMKLKENCSKENITSSFLISGLVEGIENRFTNDERLIHGDIRQFEFENGKFNFLTGGSGSVYALNKVNPKHSIADKWIESVLIKQLKNIDENGLLTGKAGTLALLYDKGYYDLVEKETESMMSQLDEGNITLRTGLSGIGLYMLSLFFSTKKEIYLQFALNIEKLIKKSQLNNEDFLKINDWMAVEAGFVDGLSGVSVFYSALYAAIKREEFLSEARKLIDKDLKKSEMDDKNEVLQILDDRNRLLPYLSGGSIGVGIAIWFFNYVSSKNICMNELKAISELSKTRCTITGGFFDGAGSFVLLPAISGNSTKKDVYIKNIMKLINLFIIEKDGYLCYPGQFSYRLSDDVYTGSSGIILALLSMERSNPMYWLPLANSDNFFEKVKSKCFDTAE